MHVKSGVKFFQITNEKSFECCQGKRNNENGIKLKFLHSTIEYGYGKEDGKTVWCKVETSWMLSSVF